MVNNLRASPTRVREDNEWSRGVRDAKPETRYFIAHFERGTFRARAVVDSPAYRRLMTLPKGIRPAIVAYSETVATQLRRGY